VDPDPDTDRNESTSVPISKLRIETKPKRFDVFQNLKWNVSVYFKKIWKTFLCVPTSFLQKKTFLFFPKILEQNQNFLMCSNFFSSKSKTLLYNPKNFRSERERFGSIMNFVSKTNIFDFLGTLVGKRSKRSLKNVGLTFLD
jgi:hypothetical protein